VVAAAKIRDKLERHIGRLRLLDTPPPGALEPTNAVPAEYQAIVEEALRLVYDRHHWLLSGLYPTTRMPFSLERLREGPLGQDLARLALIASGGQRAERQEVLGAIARVLQLLFWSASLESSAIPRSFWDQPLGQLLSLAKLRVFETKHLMSVGEAAALLGVTRVTVHRWMDDNTLDWVRDGLSGRTFVVRESVEALKAELKGPSGTPYRLVTETPGVMGAYPVVRGTRVSVRAIVEALQETKDVTEVLDLYPQLSPEQVQDALAYYRADPTRVDEDIATNRRAIALLQKQPWPGSASGS
jgi:excisionase family DNA binding protein